AAGTYYLDCGNGTGVRTINKTTTSEETFTCVNRTGNTIGLAGQATGYNTAVISFSGNTKIKSVDGSLGAIFGGSADYMFHNTFADCTSLTSIPENLFAGVSGSADYMFYSTFRGCTSLTSIPEKLFTGVSDSAYSMFSSTFADCTSLTEIPEKLFAGVSGNAPEMFYMTFANCTSLTTIYGNLFSYIEDGTAVGVSGVSDSMFQGTFENCESLTEIPENLFAGIQNSAYRAFAFTFAGCTSLESIPGKLFANIQDAADEMFSRTFRGCTSVKTITGDLFNSIYGWAPESAFQGTFADCESLESIPKDIFVNITGSSDRGFLGVFAGCKSLKELPDGLFKNITYASDSGAFENAFYGCTNLSGYVPVNMFQNLSAEYFESSTMENIFSDTGLDAVCPSGMYQYITGFESAWSGKVSCASCPDGTTSDVGSTDKSQCVSSVKLHIGDDAVLNLLPTRPTTSPVMVFQVGDTQYYAPTSNTETPVNSGTNTKYRILYEDTDYWVHDYTVQ
ncbi:MAG: leucine-rich repeat protein, partial [Alphaproteobacteria bacterium]|nr:leucine-rich repeat protein [Alphaproteobacteria bacterium]